MKTAIFKRHLTHLIEHTDQFVVDPLSNEDVKDIRETAKKNGFSDVMVVSGKDDREIFLVHISKI